MNVYTPGFRILFTDSKDRATHSFNYCPFGYDYLLIISSIVPKRYLVRTTMDDKIVNPTNSRRPSNNTRLRANPYTTPNPPPDLSPWGKGYRSCDYRFFPVSRQEEFKYGVCFCYRAHLLRISGWSEKCGFLRDGTF